MVYGIQTDALWEERGYVDRYIADEARRVDRLENLWGAQVSLYTRLP